MSQEIILTQEGLEELKVELKHLLEVVRPKVIEELVEARNQGDLSENADYDAARNRQAEVEARIKEVESLINRAKVIEDSSDSSNEEVKIGSTVEFVSNLDKKVREIKIVGAIEADPFSNLISNESPIAKAMLGKKAGVTVEIKDIAKPYKITIKKIK
ncbi:MULTISPECIES: transcription elongation factor GreA [Mycoplasma]|uniref:Transcription elongation factor GreA n=3 Tax=Mycoplasma TaxID=2093 RepID=S6G739_9MOLU|nr:MULTISPECIES: transcription elongation factor GreA [Mycoplasma]AJM71896.1 transcription elongation factor GreA [Mycoplasma yeatsii GM274B]EOA07603.1 Transcription elongation factor [Mycoplasma yeatsii 13926]MDQ0567882.1 transcription elongation factor GreA [Mycoplasma yeatsii]UWD34656.1 transcription elongation factor GreA [Mycoplasma cottewii]